MPAPAPQAAVSDAVDPKPNDPERPTTGQAESDIDSDVAESVVGASDGDGDAVMWRNVMDLGEPSIGRPEILMRFRDFKRRFPNSRHAARAVETAEILARMVDEDVAHDRQSRMPLDKMTVQDRVAELIYQLRDQNGRQISNPGSGNIFYDPRDGGLFSELEEKSPGPGSPATQLVAIGIDAVPQLIQHFDDTRLTRSIGFHRSFYFSHHALRVGDCCEQILEKIAGQSFFKRTYTNAQMVKDNRAEDSRRQAERWWADVQKKGEMNVLIENVSTGHENARTQAEMLLKRYPQAAPQAVFAGIRQTKDPWVRVALIELIASRDGQEIAAFLVGQMTDGPDLTARVACGRALVTRNHPQAIAAMIREWELLPAQPGAGAKEQFADRDNGVEKLIQTLAASGKPDAIHALANGLDTRSLNQRLAVISAFGRREGNFSMSASGTGGTLNFPDDEPVRFSDEAQIALEDLLVKSLDDVAERTGLSGSWNLKSFADPRLCDIAAHVLADRLPGKYAFDLEAPTPRRDRMRIVMKNVWRREHDLPLLPVPDPARVAGLPAQQSQPLFKRMRDATSDEARYEATAALQAFGLPALSAVIEELDALPKSDPARRAMEVLAADLACIVSEIEWTDDSADPGEKLRTLIGDMKDRPFRSKGIVDLLVALARDCPKSVTGIKLAAERYGDETGVHLRVTLTDRKIPTVGSQKGWESLVNIDLDKNSLQSSQGFASYEHAAKETSYAELTEAIDRVIAAPFRKPFGIRIHQVQSE
jgi:hypothetical protein